MKHRKLFIFFGKIKKILIDHGFDVKIPKTVHSFKIVNILQKFIDKIPVKDKIINFYKEELQKIAFPIKNNVNPSNFLKYFEILYATPNFITQEKLLRKIYPQAENLRLRKYGILNFMIFDLPAGYIFVRNSTKEEDRNIDKLYWTRPEGIVLRRKYLSCDLKTRIQKIIKIMKSNDDDFPFDIRYGDVLHIYRSKEKIRNCMFFIERESNSLPLQCLRASLAINSEIIYCWDYDNKLMKRLKIPVICFHPYEESTFNENIFCGETFKKLELLKIKK